MSTKIFHVYCNGFEKTAKSLPEAQTYIDWLRTQSGCVGNMVVVSVGVNGVFEPGYPERREILKAA